MEQPKKMDLRSMNITEEHKARLKELFPHVFNEDKIDFERLRQTLGEDIDTGLERFGLTWPGKSECMKIIQQPSIGTLKPCKEESVNFDTTEHLFIEGDNLEVLKLLQKSYYGKVKMICIDPPYNTGKEFIYPDKYSESLETYLAYTGQVDAEGKKFSTNTEADGRFHSKWLNMMYPRLFLARNLLAEDGVIFISIDDHEVDNLKKMCNEIFGEENQIGVIANVNNPKGRSDDKFIATAHEYLLIYSKSKNDTFWRGFEPEDKVVVRYNKEDLSGKYREIDLRKTGDNDRREDRPNLFYFFYYNQNSGEFYQSKDETIPDGFIQIIPTREDGAQGNWRWEIKTATEKIKMLIPKYMTVRKKWGVFEKDYFDKNDLLKPISAWTFKDVNSERGSELLVELSFSKEIFPRPKPLGLLKRVFTLSTEKDDIVFDFFSGSATTAHAVFDLNRQDGGQRKFILAQLPETCAEDSEAFKAGYKTIADIGKERMRRVIKKIQEESKGQLDFQGSKMDLGFKVFKLDQSNFKIWDGAVDETADGKKIEKQLELQIEHINPKATEEDILYELLLKSGYTLTTKVESLQLAGKKVYSIENGDLLICLEKKLTKEVITEMARKEPARVICLDTGFSGNDQLKTNAVQIMKSHKVEDFRTV